MRAAVFFSPLDRSSVRRSDPTEGAPPNTRLPAGSTFDKTTGMFTPVERPFQRGRGAPAHRVERLLKRLGSGELRSIDYPRKSNS